MTDKATESPKPTPPRGVSSSEGLGPLLDGWANVEGVRFVSRSYGQYTTATVSRDGLRDLVRAAFEAGKLAERNRCRYPQCVENEDERCPRWLTGECEGPNVCSASKMTRNTGTDC